MTGPEIASFYEVAFAQGYGYGYENALRYERDRCKVFSKRWSALMLRIDTARAAEVIGRFLYAVARLED